MYTTIYPGVEPFLQDWYRSVLGQTDLNFQLWIGLDQIEPQEVERVLGARLDAVWVLSRSGSTAAQVREKALARIIDSADGVVLVDSDDILHPTRVASARMDLQASDVSACALRLVDYQKQSLGKILSLGQHDRPEEILPRNNVFGFSNSAYRSELLRQCLPIPSQCVLVDWFLATRAWLLGARLSFDSEPRMDYRQHGSNIAGIRFPFEIAQVVQGTARVRDHYEFLRNAPMKDVLPERWATIQKAADELELFRECVVAEPEKLQKYVSKLNSLNPQTVWWWEVAQPELSWIWKEHAGEAYEACRH